ncbi:hypothetical protein EXE44_18300, partial [Halorubrum sp. SS7]
MYSLPLPADSPICPARPDHGRAGVEVAECARDYRKHMSRDTTDTTDRRTLLKLTGGAGLVGL